MARFTTLYSGSSGNAGVAEADGRFLMVDMGANCKTTLAALAMAGLAPENLAGILVTHEHVDHIRGLAVFLKRYAVPVYGSAETLDALWNLDAVPPAAELVALGDRWETVGPFRVRAFATSHDAAGCRGYRLETADGSAMAIATDLGVAGPDVVCHFEGTGLAALEANYDAELLRTGRYPWYLKQRISSPKGHLSNHACGQVVAALVAGGTRRVALCHLSEENNRPELAAKAVHDALGEYGVRLPEDGVIQVARRHAVSEWMEF